MPHPAVVDGSVVVDGRASRRGVVVGGAGLHQRPLGLLLGTVGVVVLDDVILPAEEGDDGWKRAQVKTGALSPERLREIPADSPAHSSSTVVMMSSSPVCR